MATTEEIDYNGTVYCPTVSTGCFVARRNGMIFLTGNSGFPKALNIGKAIDRKQGNEREVIGKNKYADIRKNMPTKYNTYGYGEQGYDWSKNLNETAPTSPEAKLMDGSYAGFQPKPALEVIIVAMKPLSEKTYVEQVLKNGKGVTWLDNCRIPFVSDDEQGKMIRDGEYTKEREGFMSAMEISSYNPPTNGRFPANLLVSDNTLDIESNGAIAPVKSGQKGFGGEIYGKFKTSGDDGATFYSNQEESNSFSRYFDVDRWFEERVKELPDGIRKTYPFLIVPKPSKSEKNLGCEELEGTLTFGHFGDSNDTIEELVTKGGSHTQRFMKCNKCGKSIIEKTEDAKCQCENPEYIWKTNPNTFKNNHPTVKSITLMSYLITLGSRKGDLIYDPFIGSGTTAIESELMERRWVASELDTKSCEIVKARLSAVPQYAELPTLTEVKKMRTRLTQKNLFDYS